MELFFERRAWLCVFVALKEGFVVEVNGLERLLLPRDFAFVDLPKVFVLGLFGWNPLILE